MTKERLALVVTLALACVTCKGPLTPQDTAMVAVETAQQTQCVERFAPDAAAERACRQAVKETWDAYWRRYFDDGGSDGDTR